MRGCFKYQWIFFGDSFNKFAHFTTGDLWMYLPIPCWVFSIFLTKNDMSPMSHPPYSPDLAPSNCPPQPIKKVLKGRWFADMEEIKKKSEALKSIKIDEFKNCFEQWKKCLDGWVCCIKWRVFWRWLKFKTVRINTQFFINKFQGFWVSLMHHSGYPQTLWSSPGNSDEKILI